MFLNAIIIILIVSFIWALMSLRTLRMKKTEKEEIRKELKKGRVVFHSSSDSSE